VAAGPRHKAAGGCRPDDRRGPFGTAAAGLAEDIDMALQSAPPPAHRRAARRAGATRRRGIASLVAMLYLIIFAALALGFYAQTNMSVQTSNNERRMKEALLGAETGLQFTRYQLSRLTLNPLLTDDQVFEEVQMELAGKLDGTNNLGGATVGDIVYDPMGVNAPYFEIPGQAGKYIKVNASGPWFRVRLEKQGRDMVVTTIGKSGNTVASSSGGRAGIEVRFRTKEWPNKVFTYGMASPNTVSITVAKMAVSGNQASILSTYTGGTPVTIGNVSSTVTQPTALAGNISLMSGAPNPTYVGTNYSVNGLTTSAAINAGINRMTDAPEWPVPDVSVYTKYATTKYTGGTGTFDNIYLDAATTPTVAFDQNSTIRGVLYVKKGVKLSFSGAVNLQCVIVGEPAGTIATPNLITFSGNGVAKLPLSSLPNLPQFDGVRDLTGTFIIAPRWEVQIAGNFVSAAGSIIADKITMTGNAPATITGTLLNLGNYPLTVTGSSGLSLSAPAEEKHPGVRFTERFVPVKSSYKEVSIKG
jgi:hypothetical protein